MDIYNRVTDFCKFVKQSAKEFKTFEEFYKHAHSMNQSTLKQSDFNRLVQVAAIEANLE